jgi:hypothetical protein
MNLDLKTQNSLLALISEITAIGKNQVNSKMFIKLSNDIFHNQQSIFENIKKVATDEAETALIKKSVFEKLEAAYTQLNLPTPQNIIDFNQNSSTPTTATIDEVQEALDSLLKSIETDFSNKLAVQASEIIREEVQIAISNLKEDPIKVEVDPQKVVSDLANDIVDSVTAVPFIQEPEENIYDSYDLFKNLDRTKTPRPNSTIPVQPEELEPEKQRKKKKKKKIPGLLDSNDDIRDTIIDSALYQATAEMQDEHYAQLTYNINTILALNDEIATNETIPQIIDFIEATFKASDPKDIPNETLPQLREAIAKFSLQSLKNLQTALASLKPSLNNITFELEELSTPKAIAILADAKEIALKHLEQGKDTAEQVLDKVAKLVEEVKSNRTLLNDPDLNDIPHEISAILDPFKQNNTEGSKRFFFKIFNQGLSRALDSFGVENISSLDGNIEVVEEYVKAVIEKLSKDLQQQYQPKKLEPDSDHTVKDSLAFREVFNTIIPKKPHDQSKPPELLEEEEPTEQNTTVLDEQINASITPYPEEVEAVLSSFSLAYNPIQHIESENKSDKLERVIINTKKPSIGLQGNKEFIKNFLLDQQSKIEELHKILNDIKNKPDIVEKLKQIHDQLQHIKQQTKANNWQKGNPKKAELKQALKKEILALETLIKEEYPKDASLKTTIQALKAAAEMTSKPSKFVDQINTVIIGGQLEASYDQDKDSIIFNKSDGSKVMEVKRSGEDSLSIESGIEIPTNETVTQMVLQAKEALKKINDETKIFKVIDCENSPEAALRIYLFGKAAGLNPVMKDTDKDNTKAAVEEFLKKPEAEHSLQDKKLIEIYNQFSKTTGILADDQKKELLKELKDWEKDVSREYVVKAFSTSHKKL